jgi:hypothetical protein
MSYPATESLGPKPTAQQMALLKKLAASGVAIHWASGIGGTSSAWLVSRAPSAGTMRERVRTDTLDKFKSWGWVKAVGDPGYAWRGNEYVLADKGLKVIQQGSIR